MLDHASVAARRGPKLCRHSSAGMAAWVTAWQAGQVQQWKERNSDWLAAYIDGAGI
jgi:hypothetical protein